MNALRVNPTGTCPFCGLQSKRPHLFVDGCKKLPRVREQLSAPHLILEFSQWRVYNHLLYENKNINHDAMANTIYQNEVLRWYALSGVCRKDEES